MRKYFDKRKWDAQESELRQRCCCHCGIVFDPPGGQNPRYHRTRYCSWCAEEIRVGHLINCDPLREAGYMLQARSPHDGEARGAKADEGVRRGVERRQATWRRRRALEMPDDTQVRIMSRVVSSPAGCWIWTGMCRRGCQQMTVHGKATNVRRWMWRQHKGDLPRTTRLTACPHDSRCINPDHAQIYCHRKDGSASVHALHSRTA